MAAKQTLEKPDDIANEAAQSIPQIQTKPIQIPPRKANALSDRRMQQGGYERNRWDVTVERGASHTDLLDPAFWSNVSRRLTPTDEITALSEDGRWYARYLVIGSGRLWAKVHLLEHHALDQDGKDLGERDEDGYDVDWMGPVAKHAVMRKKDKTIVKDGFGARSEAWAWVETHVKGLIAAA